MDAPVEESICKERMETFAEKIQLMFLPVQQGIARIEKEIGSLRDGNASYVPRSEYNAKCKEIDSLKADSKKHEAFMNRALGGLLILQILIGLAVKLL